MKHIFLFFVIAFLLITNTSRMSEGNMKLLEDGSLEWVQDPRALYISGITYFGSVSKEGDIQVSSYNHETGAVYTKVLYENLEVDDHNMPTLYQRQDGKIIAFFCMHSGNNIYYKITDNALDITAWGSLHTLENGGSTTYPNPVYLSSEDKLYLFFRYPLNGWAYRVSSDDGDSFGNKVRLLETSETANQYIKLASNNTNLIYFIHSGHPYTNGVDESIYAFYYKNGSFYQCDGTLIGTADVLPLERSDITLVYDHTQLGNYDSWITDVYIDSEENPVILFATYIDKYTDIRLNYARYISGSFAINEIGTLYPLNRPQAWWTNSGATIDENDINVVFYSTLISDVLEICKAVTTDSGASWTITQVTNNSEHHNSRPYSVLGTPADNIIWDMGTWVSYTNYDTDIYINLSAKYSAINNAILSNAAVVTNYE
jgi:hypothetical protein